MDPLSRTTQFQGPARRDLEEDRVHQLVVVEGAEVGRRIQLGSGTLTIGRRDDCDVQLDDPAVSGRHCELWVEHGRLFVKDLQSTNGVFIGGERVQGSGIVGADGLVQIGHQLLRHESRSHEEVELAGDLVKARAYVEALIPPPWTSGPVRTEWSYEPSAALGGDLIGYHRLDDSHSAFYLLDVCGHGVGAALHSAAAVNALRKEALPETDFTDPAQVLGRLNVTFPMEDHGGMYFSLWYGVYDESARRLNFAAAGHPPALLLRHADPETAAELHVRNPAIGMLESRKFNAESIGVAPGDRVVVFSDGAFEVETGDGKLWSFEEFKRLTTATGPGEDGEAQRLLEAVRRGSGRSRFDDDFSLLIVRFP